MNTPQKKPNRAVWITGVAAVVVAVIGIIIWVNSGPEPTPTDTGSGSTHVYTPPGSTDVPGGNNGATNTPVKTPTAGEQRWMNDGCLYFWAGQWLKDLWCRTTVAGNSNLVDYYYSFDSQRLIQMRVDTGEAGVVKYKNFKTNLTQAYYLNDPSVVYTHYNGRYLTAAQYVQALDNARITQLQQQLASTQQQLQQKQATVQAPAQPMVSAADAQAMLAASQQRMTAIFLRPECDYSYNGCL